MSNTIATLRSRPGARAVVASGLLALGGAVIAPRAALADQVAPPAVPGDLAVPAGHTPFAEGHATGTQNYECRQSGSSYQWTFTEPVATLQTRHGAIEHFLSGNPDEGGTARPTWQSSRDGSAVWAKKSAEAPVADAIPWLLLEVVGDADGAGGGDRLSQASYIHRVNTGGGQAPGEGCDHTTVGNVEKVPYTADYIFYRDTTVD